MFQSSGARSSSRSAYTEPEEERQDLAELLAQNRQLRPSSEAIYTKAIGEL